MKAISLWQPWASLWLSSSKQFETRSWAIRHTGPLLVHAAKREALNAMISHELETICVAQFGEDWRRTLPRGALLGCVDIAGVFTTESLRSGEKPRVPFGSMEDACGNFEPLRFGWCRSHLVTRFKNPPAYRGRQRLFDVPDDIVTGLAKEVIHV